MQDNSKSPKQIIDWSQIYEVMGWDKSYLHRMIAGETFNLTEIMPVHKVRLEDSINKKSLL
jgi:hypothetical protein